MKKEKGLTYIGMIIVLIIINIYLASEIIFTDVVREQLIWLFFMIISTISLIHIRKCVERELKVEIKI